jgi:arginine-tRNA-protein transferase
MKESEPRTTLPSDFIRRMKFYLTTPQPCPYLPEQTERKVFANLAVENAVNLHDSLTRSGFRRSQSIAYRPACLTCQACRSVRIDVRNFEFTRRRRRILSANADLHRSPHETEATREQFRLLKRYLDKRHAEGGMADMTYRDFSSMVGASPVRTVIFEYRSDKAAPGSEPALEAAALTDVLRDGLSMVYSFFSPERSRQSPGAFLILDHVRLAAELGLPYVYLGYWVRGSAKMEYKSDYRPLEMLDGDDWRPVTDDDLTA